jgi:hypothetical protein
VLPEYLGDQVGRFSLTGAGLAMQQTVERSDNIPIGPVGGLVVVAAYGAGALAAALWTIGRRDA